MFKITFKQSRLVVIIWECIVEALRSIPGITTKSAMTLWEVGSKIAFKVGISDVFRSNNKSYLQRDIHPHAGPEVNMNEC